MNSIIKYLNMRCIICLVLVSGIFSSEIFSGKSLITSSNLVADCNEVQISVSKVIEDEKEVEKVVKPFDMIYIGDFKVTAYCPCEKCCGVYAKSSGIRRTSIGVPVYEGSTIAVDSKIIPYGTKVYIEGIGVRIAADCVGAIKGQKIDIFYNKHSDALKIGVGNFKVYKLSDN